MQKLVTVYLHDHAYMDGKWIKGTHADKHGHVEEHLEEYLTKGWTIKSVSGFGGAGGSASGWFAVVLDNNE
jgi:hypothetical protein